MVILTDSQVSQFSCDIDEMNSMYNGESFGDGDAKAHEIADYLDDVLCCAGRPAKRGDEDKVLFVKSIMTALVEYGAGRYEYLRGAEIRYCDERHEVIEIVRKDGKSRKVNVLGSSLIGVLHDIETADFFM